MSYDDVAREAQHDYFDERPEPDDDGPISDRRAREQDAMARIYEDRRRVRKRAQIARENATRREE